MRSSLPEHRDLTSRCGGGGARNALRLIFTREQDAGAKALWNGEKKSEQSEREHLPDKKKQKGNSMSITLIPFLSLSGGRRSLLF